MPESSRPSKQFLIRGAIAIGVIAIILIVQTSWFHHLFESKKKIAADTQTTSLNAILTKDTNGEGVPDWEQVLWGLDPNVAYTDGKPNSEIIKEKEEALGVSNTSTNDPNNNQTDAIAEQLFSITTALSQNGTVDDATLQNIATQLGSSVNVASVSNKYTLADIHTVPTSSKSLTTYYNSLTTILGKVNFNDQDIPIIVQAAETGDYSQLPQLAQTGTAYVALAKQLSAISVPIGVAQYHLDIINGFSGMATSFTYLAQMQDNGTQALVGIALYRVYNARGASAFNNLRIYLTKYGILSS